MWRPPSVVAGTASASASPPAAPPSSTTCPCPADRLLGPGYGTAGRTYGTPYLQLVQLFEVGGASIASERLRLDRHWRDARTASVHNPLIYELQAIGDHELNGADLPYAWSPGRR